MNTSALITIIVNWWILVIVSSVLLTKLLLEFLERRDEKIKKTQNETGQKAEKVA